MSPIIHSVVMCLLLASSAIAAPTDTTTTTATPAGQVANEQTTTPMNSPQSSTSAPQTASAPSTEPQGAWSTPNATAPMIPVSSVNDFNSLNATTFTCYSRAIGYYADIDHDCKVYHFCLIGQYNGDVIYQRISYLCLKDTVFDQQALDCVPPAKITAPCSDSQAHFETSNAILRQAVLGGTSIDSRTQLPQTEESQSDYKPDIVKLMKSMPEALTSTPSTAST